jgi:hypothetical protein
VANQRRKPRPTARFPVPPPLPIMATSARLCGVLSVQQARFWSEGVLIGSPARSRQFPGRGHQAVPRRPEVATLCPRQAVPRWPLQGWSFGPSRPRSVHVGLVLAALCARRPWAATPRPPAGGPLLAPGGADGHPTGEHRSSPHPHTLSRARIKHSGPPVHSLLPVQSLTHPSQAFVLRGLLGLELGSTGQ